MFQSPFSKPHVIEFLVLKAGLRYDLMYKIHFSYDLLPDVAMHALLKHVEMHHTLGSDIYCSLSNATEQLENTPCSARYLYH